ncbi:MAG: type pilus assembly protein PilA [Actinomycetia bacterium]|nr:type pilus assembly protein PilA [Actinomycetes bacterium]
MMKMIWKRRQDPESGFTLVELLVVIVILGVLAGVAVFAISGISNNSKQSACKSDVNIVQTASDAYYAKNNAYAADIAALKTAGFLRQVPSTGNGYTVAYSATDGSVTGGTGTGYAGCP